MPDNNKIKKMAKQEDFKAVEVPLTSDLVLDDEKNKAKNVNNKGYKLANKETRKAEINVDNQIVKGIDKSFNQMVLEKMEQDGIKRDGKVEEDDDDIPANEYKKAEPLIPIFGYDLIKKLFSKVWRNKEEALKQITNEVQNYPKSNVLGEHQLDKVIAMTTAACSYSLNTTISQVAQASMELMKILLNKFRSGNIQGYTRQDFNANIDQCLMHILEKIGDSNFKLKEKAENTVVEIANSPLIGHKIVFEHLITGQIKKTLINSAKHLSSRLSLISRMIENFGLNLNEVPIDALISLTVNGYKNPNKEVRDAAFNLLMNIYKYMGADIRAYLKDLRPAQLNTLEEGFENSDGVADYGRKENTKNNNVAYDTVEESIIIIK
jgi:hypothetical protein